jgi:hypothetical protein
MYNFTILLKGVLTITCRLLVAAPSHKVADVRIPFST